MRKILEDQIWKYNSDKYYELKIILWKIITKIGFLDFFSKCLILRSSINDIECPICYEIIKENTGCKLICNHSFHTHCLAKSFSMNPPLHVHFPDFCLNCPYCRQNILKY